MFIKFSLILFLFVISNISLSKLTSLPKGEKNLILKAFQNATYVSRKKIVDPFFKSKVNDSYFEIYNSKKKPLGYYRSIKTDTGCNSECKPLLFSLVLDEKINFINIVSTKELDKHAHQKFTMDDELKLFEILSNPPLSYATIITPANLIDAITGATKKEYKNDVVKAAGLSSFRIYQYLTQTIAFIKKNTN